MTSRAKPFPVAAGVLVRWVFDIEAPNEFFGAIALMILHEIGQTQPMMIHNEPFGSIPKTPELIAAVATHDGTDPIFDPLYAEAIAICSSQ